MHYESMVADFICILNITLIFSTYNLEHIFGTFLNYIEKENSGKKQYSDQPDLIKDMLCFLNQQSLFIKLIMFA